MSRYTAIRTCLVGYILSHIFRLYVPYKSNLILPGQALLVSLLVPSRRHAF